MSVTVAYLGPAGTFTEAALWEFAHRGHLTTPVANTKTMLDDATRITPGIIASKGVDDVVKVKSMATQETNLNEYLADRGITAHETDLAEMIVQLADDMPSHIVVPAIHRNRSEVRGIFLDRMDDAPADLSDDPQELTAAARSHLRNKFLHASVAVSGTNMGVAETGTVSIYESEGNGRMCLTLPDTLITLMGIEKLVPRFQDVEIFSQLLPRSATGERMNPYTSMWTGVTEGDGPKEFHLVLMDNGRTKTLADPVGRQALACIRCGSCMNICPVYQHTGGHAYGSVYPGPIGSIITPQLTQGLADDDPVHTLPFASSLCGACGEVCPVKIDIPTILVHLRARSVDVKRRAGPDRAAEDPQPETLRGCHRSAHGGFRNRPGGHWQDIPGDGEGSAGSADQTGESHHPDSPGDRGRGKTRFPAGHPQ